MVLDFAHARQALFTRFTDHRWPGSASPVVGWVKNEEVVPSGAGLHNDNRGRERRKRSMIRDISYLIGLCYMSKPLARHGIVSSSIIVKNSASKHHVFSFSNQAMKIDKLFVLLLTPRALVFAFEAGDHCRSLTASMFGISILL